VPEEARDLEEAVEALGCGDRLDEPEEMADAKSVDDSGRGSARHQPSWVGVLVDFALRSTAEAAARFSATCWR